jgi:hypothetical protein
LEQERDAALADRGFLTITEDPTTF